MANFDMKMMACVVALAMLPLPAFAQAALPPQAPPLPPPGTTNTTSGTNATDNGTGENPVFPGVPNPSHKPPCQIGDMICAYGGPSGNYNNPNGPNR